MFRSAPDRSYWVTIKQNFPAIDGIFLQKDEQVNCIHFLQVTMNQRGKDRKVSNKSLQSHANRLLKG